MSGLNLKDIIADLTYLCPRCSGHGDVLLQHLETKKITKKICPACGGARRIDSQNMESVFKMGPLKFREMFCLWAAANEHSVIEREPLDSKE